MLLNLFLQIIALKSFTGFCFQFNSDGKFNTTSAGLPGGITLILYTDVFFYSIGPLNHAEGFSVSIGSTTSSLQQHVSKEILI